MFKISTKPLTRSILKPYLDLLRENIPLSFTFETVAGEKYRGSVKEIKITKTDGKIVKDKPIESSSDKILSFSIVGIGLSRVSQTNKNIGGKITECVLSFENPIFNGEIEESKPSSDLTLNLTCENEPVTITRPKPK